MFDGVATLHDARVILFDHIIPRERGRTGKLKSPPGVACPVCTQNVAVSIRPLDAKMARILAVMYQTDPWAWHHVPTLTSDKGGDTVKSRHWGLIESKDGERDDGNPRNGFWRLTDLGRRFVRGEVTYSLAECGAPALGAP